MEQKNIRHIRMVCRSLGDAVSQIFLFAGDVTMKYTQYDAQRNVEWLSTDYKRRQSFMNEPTQEFRESCAVCRAK